MATIKVNNWDEFVTAVGTSGATVECPAGEVWNANNFAATGVPQVNVNCSRINGNGLIIRNIRSSASVVFMLRENTDIYDLDFLSFYLDGGFSDVVWGSHTHNWYGCKFSGISTTTGIVFSGAKDNNGSHDNYTVSPNINKGCSFNVICHNGSLFKGCVPTSTVIKNGKILFNGQKLIHGDTKVDNCLVQGEFVSSSSVASNTSIFDCVCDSITDREGFYTTVVNKDKCKSYPSSAIAVTSNQLRNAEYLLSQGFPIGVD